MSESMLKRILRYVEWGPIGSYSTKKGKTRQIRLGIPSRHFWKHWKARKEELKAVGISLRYVGDGKSKQWEVISWRPSIINQ
jgi:hypothetical protein